MNRTSPSSKLVSNAARSPDLAITGPDVARKPTPISLATICANVVLPSPGGPKKSTWSNGCPRPFAASINTRKLSRAAACPINSASVLGRSAASMSSGRLSGVVRRSSSVIMFDTVALDGHPTVLAPFPDRIMRLGKVRVCKRTGGNGGKRTAATGDGVRV